MPRISPQVASLVAQAIPLWEQLDQSLAPKSSATPDPAMADAVLQRWCKTAGAGDWEVLKRRLQWDGWDIERVRAVLAVPPVLPEVLPPWADVVEQMMQAAQAMASQSEAKARNSLALDPDHPVPFEDVLLPALAVARERLRARLNADPAALPLLTLAAYGHLERGLLYILIETWSQVLETEFAAVRPFGHNLLGLTKSRISDNPSREHYERFVGGLLQDGFLSLFQKYPVLARLTATTVIFWVEATEEFLNRLAADQPDLERIFAGKAPPGKVAAIQPGLSDPHRGGRSVMIATFESGLKLVYKPKHLGLELVYNQLLDWCNRRGLPLELRILRVLDRGNHGWVECVTPLPCESAEAAQRFFQRAGMLLCVLYALKATDCHFENLIASGEHLVLIDMETLLHPDANPIAELTDPADVAFSMEERFWDSVLRTGLLPSWEAARGGRVVDVGGLGGDERTHGERLKWVGVNTDEMHRISETVAVPPRANLPMLDGKSLLPRDYLRELGLGFEHMYRFLMEHREALLAPEGPIAAFQGQPLRFVFRATRIYGTILHQTVAPELLASGAVHGTALDLLSQAFVIGVQEKPEAWPILREELKAMEQLDIPFFTVASGSRELPIGTPIPNYFRKPSYEQVRERIASLDPDGMEYQLALIRGALYANAVQASRDKPTDAPKGAPAAKEEWAGLAPLGPDRLHEEARRLAMEIQAQAIRGRDGSAAWVGLSFDFKIERFAFRPLDDTLYSGTCGIALFLAALEHRTGNGDFHELALGALRSTQSLLDQKDPIMAQRLARHQGLGGAVGLGSTVYSCVKIAQFLREPGLLDTAHRASEWISPELIEADRSLDLMGGAAGTLLGLLALYREIPEPAILAKAVACGQHLLRQRTRIDGVPRAWATLKETPMTGLSHGAAGIAYALLRLYAVTGDPDYLAAAQEGIAYERSVFSPTAGNWPDFRIQTATQPAFGESWCHGAPGIGLARLGGLSVLDTPEVRQDIDAALSTTRQVSPDDVDHLCCGTLGRVETLLVAADLLDRPDWLEMEQKRAAWVVKRAQHLGAYQLFPDLPTGVFNPIFFQGTAGIGYELLRLADPKGLPSILLWE
jgi:type 2 lantibiotic biosynthesis protein LanM